MKPNIMMIKCLSVAFVFVVTVISGCRSTNHYLSDRGHDALDIITIGSGFGYGAKVRIGPLQTGLLLESTWWPVIRGGIFFPDIRQKYSGIPKDGDLQLLIAGAEYSEAGKSRGKGFEAGCFPVGILRPIVAPRIGVLRKGKHDVPFVHLPTRPCPSYFTDVQLVAAPIFSLRLGCNPGELLDFVLGWTTFDLYGDDAKSATPKNQRMIIECKPYIEMHQSPTTKTINGMKTVSTNYTRYLVLGDRRTEVAFYNCDGLASSLVDTNEVYTFTLDVEGFAPSEGYNISRVENSKTIVFNLRRCDSPISPDLINDLIVAVRHSAASENQARRNIIINANCTRCAMGTISNILSSHGLQLEKIHNSHSAYRVFMPNSGELQPQSSKAN